MSFILAGVLFTTFIASIATLIVLYVLERDTPKFAAAPRSGR